ncbi:hypothetical protein Esti_006099 [Eimeria stiedai]
MVRKSGDAAEFIYGLGISSLAPAEHEQDEDDMPLRFVSIQLELPDTSRNFDIDLHAFLFQSDGTYVDCVFYKNPTLAGKSVRLLQEEKELLVDLRYVPKRCSYIVCTLAIYSGGTVAQLGNGTVKLAALVPREGVDQGAQFPHLPAGQLPPNSSDSHEWVCLGILPLKSRANRGEECGMMLCLLAQHAGFWYFKPVLRAVSAFTPQGLIEPAQDFVTEHLAGMSAEPPGVELGMLLKAVREGTQVEMDLSDTEGSVGVRQTVLKQVGMAAAAAHPKMCLAFCCTFAIYLHSAAEEEAETEDAHFQRAGEKEVPWGGEAQHGLDGGGHHEDYRWHKLSPTEGPGGKAFQAAFVEGDYPNAVQSHKSADHRKGREAKAAIAAMRIKRAPLGVKKKEARGPRARARKGEYSRIKRPEEMGPHGKEVEEEGYAVEWSEPTHGHSSVNEYVSIRGENLHCLASLDHAGDQTYAKGLQAHHGDVNAKSLFSSYPSPEKYQESYRTSGDIQHLLKAAGEEGGHIPTSWKDSVEKRLAALEGTVDSMRADIRAIAAAACDMQRNNKLYVQELRNKFTELRGDAAADIESALAGPLKALTVRLDKVEANEAADAKQLAEQQRKLWALDRMVILAERNSHLIAQSLSELRFQLAGFEQHVVSGTPMHKAASPPTDQEKGLPVSLGPAAPRTARRPSHEVESAEPAKVFAGTTEGENQGLFASKALSELSKMQYHAEAFGKCLRQLASGTAPDGVKGLNPIERKVLSFAGTPKVFDALHELERAVDAIKHHGSNASGTRLY